MTPIRDATRRLVAEGALRMSRSGRLSVPILSTTTIKELLNIALLLEPELAIRAIPRVHLALIERLLNLNTVLVEMIEQNNAEGFFRTNFEFHKTIYLRAQAPSMMALLETIWLQLGPSLKVGFESNLKSLKTSAHNDIVLALKNGNCVNLANSVKADINNNLAIFLS